MVSLCPAFRRLSVCLSSGVNVCKWHNQYPQLIVSVHCPHPTVGCFRDGRCSQAVSHHKPCCFIWPLWNAIICPFCLMLFAITTNPLAKEATPVTEYTFGNMALLLLTCWSVSPCNHALEVSLIITFVVRRSVLVAHTIGHQDLDLTSQGLCL